MISTYFKSSYFFIFIVVYIFAEMRFPLFSKIELKTLIFNRVITDEMFEKTVR